MKVIMLVDVKGVGKKGESVVVSDGYATNFLIPKNLVVRETEGARMVLEKQNAQIKKQEEEAVKNATEIAEKLKTIILTFETKVGTDGRMFGSISPKQIEQKLKADFGIEIDKRKFIDKYPVNALGFTRLNIELHKGVIAIITVKVIEEKK